MARAASTDFISNFRFAVVIRGFGPNTTPQLDTLDTNGNVTAGFNSCSAPSLEQEVATYREGHYVYTQKYPGVPSVADVTLGRGVALAQSTAWEWIQNTVEAGTEYRADVDIYHIHRDAKPQTASASPMQINTANTAMLRYSLSNAIPLTYKVASDMDATSSEISIQELTLSYESLDRVDQSQ